MKTIEEYNKLIAEFMGRCGKVNKHLYWVNIPSVKWVTVEQMQYHSSWDWLMPVVEKIEKTNLGDVIIHGKNLVEISYNKQTQLYFESSLLENTWLACVEFIEWYNNK